MAGVHGREPKDCHITENMNRYKLMPESNSIQKQDLLLVEKSRDQQGPYFFFQLLDHRSPEGYESYVGEVLSVSLEEGILEMKYRFCSSGHGTYFRTTFEPKRFFYITRINRYQYGKLQRAELHESFSWSELHQKMSQAAVFNYFSKLTDGDYIYFDAPAPDGKGETFGLGELKELHLSKTNIPPTVKNEDKRTNFFHYTNHFAAKQPEICEQDISNVLYVKRVTRRQAEEAKRDYYNIGDDSGTDSGNNADDCDNDIRHKYATDTDDEPSDEKFC